MKNLAAKILKPNATAPDPAVSSGVNPYTNAQRAWNDHVGSVIGQRDTARLVALIALLIALAVVGADFYARVQSRYIPYVVEVDRLGRQVAVGIAEQAPVTDVRVRKAAIAAWVENARTVKMDVHIQSKAIREVYALLSTNDPAYNRMNEWMNSSDDANPHKRALKELVSVEIDTVLQQSPETWQIEWTETVRDRQGATKTRFRMKALVTVYAVPTTPMTTEEEIRANPSGLYVRDFSWSKLS